MDRFDTSEYRASWYEKSAQEDEDRAYENRRDLELEQEYKEEQGDE